MKELVWSDALSVQVNEIDEDHRRLVSLYNILNHSVTNGDAPDYIDAVLDELISCTVWHFKHEERLMLKYGYKGLSEHRAEHEELIESGKALQERFRNDGQAISSENIEFLEHWLTAHILVADMDLGAYLAEAM